MWILPKQLILLSLLGVPTLVKAAPIETCQQQAPCLEPTVTSVTAPDCEGSCAWKVCLKLKLGGQCVKAAGDTVSHTCKKNEDQCPAQQWFSSATERTGLGNNFEQCQTVAGGATVEFLFKDGNAGNGCGSLIGLPVAGPPTTVSIANFGCSTFQGYTGNERSCTGKGNLGQECVWTIVAPGCPPPACPGQKCGDTCCLAPNTRCFGAPANDQCGPVCEADEEACGPTCCPSTQTCQEGPGDGACVDKFVPTCPAGTVSCDPGNQECCNPTIQSCTAEKVCVCTEQESEKCPTEELPDLNPATCECYCKAEKCGSSGDPHVYMFSGDKASPMGKGEFVLVEYEKFAVHSCHEPLGAHASRSSAYAIKSPLGLIKILRHGQPVVPTGVAVRKNGDFVFPGGEIVRASGSNGHISVTIPERHLTAGVKGLCGKYNPDAKLRDAFSNSTGHVVMTPDITKGESGWGKDYVMHFQESFRVAPENALFTEEECPRGDISSTVIPQKNPVYHGGDQAEKFEWTSCPEGMKEAAEKMCPQGLMYEECVHDVARTCDLAEWVRHTSEAHNHMNVLPHESHVSTGNTHRHR